MNNQKIVFSLWDTTTNTNYKQESSEDIAIKAKKGVYVLTRELPKDEWKVIDGVLNIKPQRGILIPKII